jgi:hypothetical protein
LGVFFSCWRELLSGREKEARENELLEREREMKLLVGWQ